MRLFVGSKLAGLSHLISLHYNRQLYCRLIYRHSKSLPPRRAKILEKPHSSASGCDQCPHEWRVAGHKTRVCDHTRCGHKLEFCYCPLETSWTPITRHEHAYGFDCVALSEDANQLSDQQTVWTTNGTNECFRLECCVVHGGDHKLWQFVSTA